MSHRSGKATSKNTVSLKLLIDKKANRVLFAEAGKDFVDFLFALLSLPLGTIIRLLQEPAAMIGCIGNLYESLENLNEAYMQPNQSKDSLLKPSVPLTNMANLPFLLPDTHHVQAEAERKVFDCNYYHFCVSYERGASCPYCRRTNELKIVDGKKINKTASSTETCGGGGGEGGFVKGLVTYLVTDDLSVSPMSMISVVSLLNKFNVRGFSSLEEKIVGFGFDEGLELLKASLQSKAALTCVFLAKDEMKDAAAPN